MADRSRAAEINDGETKLLILNSFDLLFFISLRSSTSRSFFFFCHSLFFHRVLPPTLHRIACIDNGLIDGLPLCELQSYSTH